MRRPIAAAVALLTAVSLAACGSSSSTHSRPVATPLSTALSYFPADSPVVATVSTATNSATATRLNQVPSAALYKAALFQELAKLGIDYNRDVRPLLGNPVAFGIGSSQVGAGQTSLLVAWQTRNAAALGRLVASVHRLSKAGTRDGATLYTAPGAAVAIDGPTLLASRDVADLSAALNRHAASGGFTTADYAHDTTGLPSGNAFTVVGDLAGLMAAPRDAQARLVPWVAALRDYGVTLTGSSHASVAHFHIDTTGRSLSASQLPLATGSQSPTVVQALPAAVSVRDPAQLWTFITDTVRTTSPSDYRKLLAKEAKLRRGGVDLNRLASSLTGDLQFSSNGHVSLAREAVSPATARSIERLLTLPPSSGNRIVALGGGLYRIVESGGTGVAGVVDGVFVAGKATAAQARTFAHLRASAVPGASGALVVHVALGPLLALSSRLQDNPLLPRLAAMLGDLTMSVQSSPQALTGTLSVTINSATAGAS